MFNMFPNICKYWGKYFWRQIKGIFPDGGWLFGAQLRYGRWEVRSNILTVNVITFPNTASFPQRLCTGGCGSFWSRYFCKICSKMGFLKLHLYRIGSSIIEISLNPIPPPQSTPQMTLPSSSWYSTHALRSQISKEQVDIRLGTRLTPWQPPPPPPPPPADRIIDLIKAGVHICPAAELSFSSFFLSIYFLSWVCFGGREGNSVCFYEI